MSHTFSNFLYHIVWSTKNREPLIRKELKPRVHGYIRTVVNAEGANLLFINGVDDHVHLLVATPATMLIPSLVEKVKPTSTKWFRRSFPEATNFSWQEGYGAFTVAKSILPGVIKYIENQEEHHKTMTYKEEFLRFLDEQGIPYDPEHVFD